MEADFIFLLSFYIGTYSCTLYNRGDFIFALVYIYGKEGETKQKEEERDKI